MLVTAVVTVLVAQTIPSLTCDRDDEGDCILSYEAKPLLRLHDNDKERALELYRPYFKCYYERLTEDERFGSSEGAVATAAMLSASNGCTDELSTADQLLDDLLVERQAYGDEDHRAAVRSLFRQEAGATFVYTNALEDGLGEQVEAMSEAYFQTLVAGQ